MIELFWLWKLGVSCLNDWVAQSHYSKDMIKNTFWHSILAELFLANVQKAKLSKDEISYPSGFMHCKNWWFFEFLDTKLLKNLFFTFNFFVLYWLWNPKKVHWVHYHGILSKTSYFCYDIFYLIKSNLDYVFPQIYVTFGFKTWNNCHSKT